MVFDLFVCITTSLVVMLVVDNALFPLLGATVDDTMGDVEGDTESERKREGDDEGEGDDDDDDDDEGDDDDDDDDDDYRLINFYFKFTLLLIRTLCWICEIEFAK